MTDFVKIRDLSADGMEIYIETSEVQLHRYFEPDPGVFIAECLKVIERALDAGYEALSFLIEEGKEYDETERIFRSC